MSTEQTSTNKDGRESGLSGAAGSVSWARGDEAWLELNDAFGSQIPVRILNVYRGGNVQVNNLHSHTNLLNNVCNLRPMTADNRPKWLGESISPNNAVSRAAGDQLNS